MFAQTGSNVTESALQLLPAMVLAGHCRRILELHCHVQVAMRTHYFTWINAVMISLSIGCWLPALWAFSSVEPLQRTLTDMVELGPHLFKTPAFWLGVVILAPVMALLLDCILSSWQRQRRPLDRQIFQVTAWQLVQATVWLFVLGAVCILMQACLWLRVLADATGLKYCMAACVGLLLGC